jgi:hypothetical protein
MIVATVQDPAVFDLSADESPFYEAALAGFIEQLVSRHLIVCDEGIDGSLIWKEILKHCHNLPVHLQQRLNCISPQRIVYLNPVEADVTRIGQWIERDGTPEAVALACYPGIDLVVLAQDTAEAIEIEDMRRANTCCLLDYHNAPVLQRMPPLGQAIPLGGMPAEGFAAKVVEPVVRWASGVFVLDRFLARSALSNQGNWPSFKRTITVIFNKWERGYGSADEDARFVIVTEFDDHTGIAGDQQAEELARRLELSTGKVEVRIKRQCGPTNHDRFLATNKDIAIGLTRGFDIIGENGRCQVCDAYLHLCRSNDDVVRQIMNAPDCGYTS